MQRCLKDRYQILLLVLSEFERSKKPLLPLKLSKNLGFSFDFRRIEILLNNESEIWRRSLSNLEP